MNPWIKALLLATGIAVIVIIVTAMQRAADDAAWTHLAKARAQGSTVEALKAARTDAAGTVVEAWISYDLAMALYSEGSAESLVEARRIASETTTEHPDLSITPYLRDLVQAIDSYTP